MGQLDMLSKEISYALRHAPWEYELEMDENGWVFVQQLLDAFHKDEKWKNIDESDLHRIIKTSDKKRFEIQDGKIRAFYGHSIPMKILKEEKEPPDLLYHGTARPFISWNSQTFFTIHQRKWIAASKPAICSFISRYGNSKHCWQTT